MADLVRTNDVVSVIATTYSKLGLLPAVDGQIIFATDQGMACFDFDGKRSFIHSIEMIDKESDRTALLAPITNKVYFVLDTAIFWIYTSTGEWKQLTNKPEEIVCIGTSLPDVGNSSTLYVDKSNKSIAVWDDDVKDYTPVSNYCELAKESDIVSMFN